MKDSVSEKRKEIQMGLKTTTTTTTKIEWNEMESKRIKNSISEHLKSSTKHQCVEYMCVRVRECFERYLLIEKQKSSQHTCSVFYLSWVLLEIVLQSDTCNNQKNTRTTKDENKKNRKFVSMLDHSVDDGSFENLSIYLYIH